MKQVFHIALIATLLLGVTGISVSSHYCHGKVQAVKVATDAEHQSCGGMDDSSCSGCEDKVVSNVLDARFYFHAPGSTLDLVLLPSMNVPVLSWLYDNPDLSVHVLSSNGPPGQTAESDLSILHQQFLI